MSFQAYLPNMEEKTGKSPTDFEALVNVKGFTEGGKVEIEITATQITNWLKDESHLGRGHAMAIYAYIKGKRE